MIVGQSQLIRKSGFLYSYVRHDGIFRLLRNVLAQYGFRFLDVHCQQNLSTKFDLIQANLVV